MYNIKHIHINTFICIFTFIFIFMYIKIFLYIGYKCIFKCLALSQEWLVSIMVHKIYTFFFLEKNTLLKQFLNWQSSKVQFDLNLSNLHQLLMKEFIHTEEVGVWWGLGSLGPISDNMEKKRRRRRKIQNDWHSQICSCLGAGAAALAPATDE